MFLINLFLAVMFQSTGNIPPMQTVNHFFSMKKNDFVIASVALEKKDAKLDCYLLNDSNQIVKSDEDKLGTCSFSYQAETTDNYHLQVLNTNQTTMKYSMTIKTTR